MRKGKHGVVLRFYAVLAFILVLFGQTTLCGLLLGFVLIAEKDEWLSKQVIQALLLAMFSRIISFINSNFTHFYFKDLEWLASILNGTGSVVVFILNILFLIFIIVALLNVSKEKEAKVPLAQSLANWAFGIVREKVYVQQPAAQQPPYQAPPQQPPYQAPDQRPPVQDPQQPD